MTCETAEWLRYAEAQNQIFPDTARQFLSINCMYTLSAHWSWSECYARCQRETGERILRTVFGASIQPKGAKRARPSGGEKGGLYESYDAAETDRAAASYEVAASRHGLARA